MVGIMALISIDKFAEDLKLEMIDKNGHEYIDIDTAEVTRPGLQLAGFFDYFASNRVQVIGKVEMSYLAKMDSAGRYDALNKYFEYRMPCTIISQDLTPFDEMLATAKAHRRVLLYSPLYQTSKLEQVLINYLNRTLAPSMTRHGVLMDIYGVGILITGDSGMGKSETALELIQRGHRLVSDDAVLIRRVSEGRLVGEAPEVIRHFMEIRGIGIINIGNMYGVSAVIHSKSVDIVIHLELWDEKKEYDRLGINDESVDILGVKLPKITVPVRPGRNISIIVEIAARNFRLHALGYNALEELYERRQKIFAKDG